MTLLILMTRNFRGKLYHAGDIVTAGRATAQYLIRMGIAEFVYGDT